jgi:hypothetical protein
LAWGTGIANAHASSIINFNFTFTNVYSVQYSMVNAANVNDVDVHTTSVLVDKFTVYNSTGVAYSINWFAIGS